ncbi:hypothetical protein C7377_1502 [Balneicella halophila]|uniref:SPW repeat-containing protein n=1 Tax=Balneicella halophila TaxID=1537566 RepID=A0A7L4UML6_BALHA|nr:hypothetical protein [Balneicella halophila]PVX49864.1 hypothetical protein C7377_1502 [Balneicella halophila]
MKLHLASLQNALILIVISLWGYLSSETPSLTALIPTFIGLALLLLNSGIKAHKKIAINVSLILTVIVLIGLIKPLLGAIDRNSSIAIIRVVVMFLSTLCALLFFIKYLSRKKKIS